MKHRHLLTILIVLSLFAILACEEPDEVTSNATEPLIVAPEPVASVQPAPVAAPMPAPLPPLTQEPQPVIVVPAPVETPALNTTPPVVVPPKPVVTPKAVPAETPVAPTPVKKEFVEGTSEKLQELLGLADKKVKSYEFVFAPPPDNLARDHYYIKGTKVRISLYQLNYFKQDNYYDTVFVDTVKKTATGYCEGLRPGRCFNTSQFYTLPYAEWSKTKTPYQWLKEIPFGEIVGSENVYDRPAFKVYYEKDGIMKWFWLDSFSGLPVRIIEQKGDRETKYEFRYLAVNSVTDDFVEHFE